MGYKLKTFIDNYLDFDAYNPLKVKVNVLKIIYIAKNYKFKALNSKNKTYLNAYTSVNSQVHASKVYCCSLDSNAVE